MVAEILGSMGAEPMVKGSDYRPTDPGPVKKDTHLKDGDFVPDVTALDLRQLYLTEAPANKAAFAKLKAKTPARCVCLKIPDEKTEEVFEEMEEQTHV